MFKVPRRNISNIWVLIKQVQEKSDVKKSPEEEMCLREINKCLEKRSPSTLHAAEYVKHTQKPNKKHKI